MKIYAVEYLVAWGSPLGIWCYKTTKESAEKKAEELMEKGIAVWAKADEKKVED